MKFIKSTHILLSITMSALLFTISIAATTEPKTAIGTVYSLFTTVIPPATVVRIPDPTACPAGMTPVHTDPKSFQIKCSEGSTTYIPIPFLAIGFVGSVVFFVLRAIL
jgi:hypothetical protein